MNDLQYKRKIHLYLQCRSIYLGQQTGNNIVYKYSHDAPGRDTRIICTVIRMRCVKSEILDNG